MDKFKIKIWIDADACPKVVKEVIFKASFRLNASVTLVANSYINIPKAPNIDLIQVEKGADVADFYIVENVSKDDLVVTADVPLAALILEKGAVAINPRGELYTEENIGERLSVRDFKQELMDGGEMVGGPPALGPKDKARFTNAFDRITTQMLRR